MTLALDSDLLAFAVVATIITVIPGVDMALIARSVLTHGRRAGYVTSVGVWLILYAYFLGRLSTVLRRPRVRRALEGVTGTLLITIGGRLAWDRR